MQVTIDGVPYAPACNSGSRIGISITTHNRPAVLAKTIEQHLKHLLAGAKLIVIDADRPSELQHPDFRYK